jgi:hypothetical protein
MRLGCLRRRVGLTRVRVGAVLRARTIFSQALGPLSILYGHIIILKAICTLIRLAKAFVLRRGSFAPELHQLTRTLANKHDTFSDKIRHFAGISERQRTTAALWICLHTAEGAGLSPASLTKKYLQIAWYQEKRLGSLVQNTMTSEVRFHALLAEGRTESLQLARI